MTLRSKDWSQPESVPHVRVPWRPSLGDGAHDLSARRHTWLGVRGSPIAELIYPPSLDASPLTGEDAKASRTFFAKRASYRCSYRPVPSRSCSTYLAFIHSIAETKTRRAPPCICFDAAINALPRRRVLQSQTQALTLHPRSRGDSKPSRWLGGGHAVLQRPSFPLRRLRKSSYSPADACSATFPSVLARVLGEVVSRSWGPSGTLWRTHGRVSLIPHWMCRGPRTTGERIAGWAAPAEHVHHYMVIHLRLRGAALAVLRESGGTRGAPAKSHVHPWLLGAFQMSRCRRCGAVRCESAS